MCGCCSKCSAILGSALLVVVAQVYNFIPRSRALTLLEKAQRPERQDRGTANSALLMHNSKISISIIANT